MCSTLYVSAASLTGIITDKLGSRISGASISLYSEERDWHTTSFEGRFQFDNLPDGAYALEVARDGFQRRTWENIQLPSNSGISIAIDVCTNRCGPDCTSRAVSYDNVEPGVALRGVVVRDDGRRLAGATISVRSGASQDFIASAISNDRGEFELSGLPPGRYVVSASLAGYSPAVIADVRVMSSRTTVIELGILLNSLSRICQ